MQLSKLSLKIMEIKVFNAINKEHYCKDNICMKVI